MSALRSGPQTGGCMCGAVRFTDTEVPVRPSSNGVLLA